MLSGVRRFPLLVLLAGTVSGLAPLPATAQSGVVTAGQGAREAETRKDPRQNRRLYEQALRLELEKKWPEAIAAYGEVLAVDPDNFAALRRRAQVLYYDGRREEATHDFAAALFQKPDDGETWVAYGDCLSTLGQHAAAAGAYRNALEHGQENAATYTRLGNALKLSGDKEAALTAFGAAIRARLDDPNAYINRGDLLMEMKRERDAIEDYTRAVEFQPKGPVGYMLRATAWGQVREFDRAVKDLAQYIELRPDDPQGYAMRGAANDSLGEYQKALADYAESLRRQPRNPRVLLARGSLLHRYGNYADALADFDRAIEIDPSRAYLWMSRGGTQLALGSFEKALSDRTKAVELAPSNASMYYARAVVYSAMARKEQAAADLRRTLDLDPDFPDAKRLLDQLGKPPASPTVAVAIKVQPPVRQTPGDFAGGTSSGKPLPPPKSLREILAQSTPPRPDTRPPAGEASPSTSQSPPLTSAPAPVQPTPTRSTSPPAVAARQPAQTKPITAPPPDETPTFTPAEPAPAVESASKSSKKRSKRKSSKPDPDTAETLRTESRDAMSSEVHALVQDTIRQSQLAQQQAPAQNSAARPSSPDKTSLAPVKTQAPSAPAGAAIEKESNAASKREVDSLLRETLGQAPAASSPATQPSTARVAQTQPKPALTPPPPPVVSTETLVHEKESHAAVNREVDALVQETLRGSPGVRRLQTPPTRTAAVPSRVREPAKPAVSRESLEPAPEENGSTISRESAEQLHREARTLLANEDLQAASAKLMLATMGDPGNPQIWNAYGFCLMKMKRYREAVEALDKAIALKPDYENAYRNRSAVKRHMGDLAGAEQDRRRMERLVGARP